MSYEMESSTTFLMSDGIEVSEKLNLNVFWLSIALFKSQVCAKISSEFVRQSSIQTWKAAQSKSSGVA